MVVGNFAAVLLVKCRGTVFALIWMKFVMAIWIALKETMRKIVVTSKVKYSFSVKIDSINKFLILEIMI